MAPSSSSSSVLLLRHFYLPELIFWGSCIPTSHIWPQALALPLYYCWSISTFPRWFLQFMYSYLPHLTPSSSSPFSVLLAKHYNLPTPYSFLFFFFLYWISLPVHFQLPHLITSSFPFPVLFFYLFLHYYVPDLIPIAHFLPSFSCFHRSRTIHGQSLVSFKNCPVYYERLHCSLFYTPL